MATISKRHYLGTVLGLTGMLLASPAFGQSTTGYDEFSSEAEPVGLFEVAEGDIEDANVNMDSFGKVDLAVKDLEIAKVLQLLSIQSQKNIVTSRNVSGTVSADLYGVTFHEALTSILEPNGFGYEEKGNFIYVYTADELKEREDARRTLTTKVIRLNYLNGEDAKTIAEAMVSDSGSITFSSAVEGGMLPSESDAGANSFALPDAIIVRDYEENVSAIEALVAELDVRPKQVLIEATILQASLTEDNEFGVDFSVFTNLNAFDFANPLNVVNNLIGGNGPAGDSGGAVQSGVGNTAAPGGVKVGYVGSDAAVFVRALDTVTDTTVVAKPNILVLNRQKADLLVGQRLGYLSTTVTDTSNTQTVEFLDVGTQLTVRPFISNEGTVRLELRPAISDGSVREQAGFVIPDETTQELITNVIVEDGQTVVIGGLFKEDVSNSRNQVPGLGDIPLLGAAFKGEDDSVERSEVIFLIKTSIMEPTHLTRGGEAAEEAIRNKRLGAKQGLLPWSNEKLVSSNLITAREALENGDDKKALWHTNLALHIAPTSADALALKQKITGEQIAFHDRSQLKGIMDALIEEDVEAFAPTTPDETANTQRRWNDVPPPTSFQDEAEETPTFSDTTKATTPAEPVATKPEPTPEVTEVAKAEAFEAETSEPAATYESDFTTETDASWTAEASEAFDNQAVQPQADQAQAAKPTETPETWNFDSTTDESFDAELYNGDTATAEVAEPKEFTAPAQDAPEEATLEFDWDSSTETAEVQTQDVVEVDDEWSYAFPEVQANQTPANQAQASADAPANAEFSEDTWFEAEQTAQGESAPEFTAEPAEGEDASAEAETEDPVFNYYEQLMSEVNTDDAN